jgi:cytochrome b6-f complex iron-sulfur subunit
MNRKEFLAQVGIGASALFIPACIGGLAGCSSNSVTGSASVPTAPTNIDFTLEVSSGELSVNGGFTVNKGVIVARTNSGTFVAVSAACTHEGTTLQYFSSINNFRCSTHGSMFNTSGLVTMGPATMPLMEYNTLLTGTSLRVFS